MKMVVNGKEALGNERWMTKEEARAHLNTSLSSIDRRIKKDYWEKEYEHNPNGQPILYLKINISSSVHVKSVHVSECHSVHVKSVHVNSVHVNSVRVSACQNAENVFIEAENPPLPSFTKEGVSDGQADAQADMQNSITIMNEIESVKPPCPPLEKWGVSERQSEIATTSGASPVTTSRLEIGTTETGLFRSSQRQSGLGTELVCIDQERETFYKFTEPERKKAETKHEIVLITNEKKKAVKKNGERIVDFNKKYQDQINMGMMFPDKIKFLYGVTPPVYEVAEDGELKVKTVLSIGTIYDWAKKVAGDIQFPVSLIDGKRGNVGAKSKLDQDVINKISLLAIAPNKYKTSYIFNKMKTVQSIDGKKFDISGRAIRNIVSKARKNDFAANLVEGKTKFKDRVRTHVKRVNQALPNEIWESDGHVMNNWVISPFYDHAKPAVQLLVRPIVVLYYDLAGGVITGWRPCLAESTRVARNALKSGIMRFGMPEMLRLDNASSYKNNANCPDEQAYKGAKKGRQEALKLIQEGKIGLYNELGIKYSFTRAYNPESKSIEPFWNFCLSDFEKSFFSYTGRNIEERPEHFKNKNLTVIFRQYGDKIPTWEEYWRLFGEHVERWNNTKRECLESIDGEILTPLEYYEMGKIDGQLPRTMSADKLERIMRDPYIEHVTVRRGEISVGGVRYSHPEFYSLNGEKIGFYFDEINLSEMTIYSTNGMKYTESAKAIPPGYQVGDDMTALIDSQRRNLHGTMAYFTKAGLPEKERNQKSLEMTTEQLIANQDELQKQIKHGKKEMLTASGTRMIEKRVNIEYQESGSTKTQELEYKPDIFELLDRAVAGDCPAELDVASRVPTELAVANDCAAIKVESIVDEEELRMFKSSFG